MLPSSHYAIQMPPAHTRPASFRTLGPQWLTESFFCPSTGKILPGQYGQQAVIAALTASPSQVQLIELTAIPKLARLSLC
jgi:hypothetical protein